ncbi:hypothetical protein [Gulosibacter chungangensis]|uniref:Uncharacterized protein n=1 Tax=Gulosibacter chungangensis TaxID=979746 RepID=A0A7J5BDZ9_9MICO|nr:hypothetical protein [Gulosibacter chungangensis]KAB1643508.1 hypothetical protein F8O05_06375 [Gulosibacter chungangensis]
MLHGVGVQVPPPALNERCCNPRLRKQVLGYSIAILVAVGVLVGPGDGLLLGGLIEDALKRYCSVGGEGVVLVQVDAGEERLVGEALVLLVTALIHGSEVACEVEGSVDEGAGSLIVVVVFSDLGFDPVKFCPQSGLELLQLIQAEGIDEMGCPVFDRG